MGCKIINGDDGSCFYDSVTMTCFGIVMEDQEEAESFQDWVDVDLRLLTQKEFEDELTKFREERENENRHSY